MITQLSLSSKIFKSIPFTKEELAFIDSRLEIIELKKGDVLINPNNYVKSQYYVLDGCLRSYFMNKEGKDYTVQFAIKDWWISDFISYFKEEKSIMTIECLTDATICRISKENMSEISLKFPQIDPFFRKKLERAFASFQQRIIEYLSLTAKDRYIKFTKTYPEITEYVRNYHIASYLGITTESLSRIRKSI